MKKYYKKRGFAVVLICLGLILCLYVFNIGDAKASIVLDSVQFDSDRDENTLTWSHAIGSGSNVVLVIFL